MHSTFFNGRSRPNQLTLARDHRPTREAILADTQRARQARAEERRRQRAAVCLQRAVRQFLSQQTLIGLCVAQLDGATAATSSATAASSACQPAKVADVPSIAELDTAVFCFRYLRAHMHQIPRDLLGTTWPQPHSTASNPAGERAARVRAFIGGYTGQLLESVRRFLSGTASPQVGAAAAGSTLVSPAAVDALKQVSGRTLVFLTESFVRDLLLMSLEASSAKTACTTAADSQTPLERTARTHTVTDVVALLQVLADVGEQTPDTRWLLGATVLRCVEQAGRTDTATEDARRTLLRPFRRLIERGLCDLFPAPAVLTDLSHLTGVPGTGASSARNEEGEEAFATDATPTAVSESAVKQSSRTEWERVLWATLTSTTWPQENMPLTRDGLAALWSLREETTSAAPAAGTFSTDSCAALFSVAAAKLQPSFTHTDGAAAAATTTTTTENEDANQSPAGSMAALARLTRLLPCVLTRADSATGLSEGVRQRWLFSVARLTERLCITEEFVDHILFDLHHSRTSASPKSDPTAVRYRYLVSHLFSGEGGLQLLADYGSAAVLSEPSKESVGASGPQQPSPTAAAALVTSLELCSSIFAWPLYAFSMSDEATHRLETAALFAKLTRSPALLRQLWSLYRERTASLRRALVEAPDTLATRLQIADKRTSATGDAAVAATLPGCDPPASVLAPLPRRIQVIRHLFYDPSPALSVLFFALLSYYVDVTDFPQDLQRGTVMQLHECTALILTLKDIVHRSHLAGVVPGHSAEAVAHLAFVLLTKLHAVNESTAFVTSESVWISVTDAMSLRPLGDLTPTRWEELTHEYDEELRIASHQQRDRAGLGSSDDDDGDDDQDATGDKRRTKRRRRAPRAAAEETEAMPVYDSFEAANAATDGTTREGVAALHVRSQPGDDPLFARSCFWRPDERIFRLLLHAPFMVPFSERGALLTTLLLNQPTARQVYGDSTPVVQRGSAFMDTFRMFRDRPESASMFTVRFRSADGDMEAGYGQGVYRELIGEVCKEGFSAAHGLFKQTVDGDIYPNPFSLEATNDPDHLSQIQFLGTMVGRAVRDGILQDVPFAQHFRNSLLGRTNAINNLRQYDAQLYEQLLALLKMSEEEMETLELTFVYTVNALGVTREVELIRGGANVPVTRRNCLHYIYLVADFKLNREAAAQTRAFQRGLERIIHRKWLQLFDTAELNDLFCGEQGKMDVEDWRRHTVYHSPEQADDPTVKIFWCVVESLSAKQQSQLLQFCTAMKHPPLFGFRFLSPPFKIQLLPNESDDRLPSAATCFSTLKLPPYKTFETARAKIVSAIEETNTFEFS